MAETRIGHDHGKRTSRPPLAIVGMAGRFPDSANHEELWDLLYAGLDVHRSVPEDRFDISKYYDPESKTKNTSHTPFGCWIKEPGLFDPRFFNMSPREAKATDPMHRLSLMTAYEALEQSGFVPGRTPSTCLDRIGTFYGQTSDDWRETNAAQDIDTYFIPGGVRAFLPGRISYAMKFTGPSLSIDTACSSSAAAIYVAALSIWAGECDTAVVGGANVMSNSDIFSGLSRGSFLSRTGNCQTFDNNADGYCRGDGVASIVMKKLEDAEADNDHVLGVIRGIATNHSANASSIVHPHAPTQADLFRRVMNDTGLDPHEVDYVEMHGTGTQAGDSTEMESVTSVFAPADRMGQRAKPLFIGSVKANVGHGEAVSGVTAVAKALLMLEKNTIPPHCGIKGVMNENFSKDLDQRNVNIAFQPMKWYPQNGPRKIFVNNFSAAGGNTAMLLEDAPARIKPRDDPRSHHIISISAKSKAALAANVRNLAQYLQQNQGCRLADISYTTTARRIHHKYRTAFSCDSTSGALDHLLGAENTQDVEPISSGLPNVCFLYTGQGSHYTALGRQLFELSSKFRSTLTCMEEYSKSYGFDSFSPLLDGSMPAEDLSPVALQTGLVAIQISLTDWWRSLGVTPNIVIGHSLGEYAALYAAGVLTASDVIYLVGRRARLLQERCDLGTHSMLALKCSVSAAQIILNGSSQVEIACVNGPTEVVLAGPLDAIEALSTEFNQRGIRNTQLRTQYAFHSAQVEPILDEFETIAQDVHFSSPLIPVVSPLRSNVLDGKSIIDGKYLRDHARHTVSFSQGLHAADEAKLTDKETIWVEIGPHPVCSFFVKAQFGPSTTTLPSFRKNTPPYQSLSESLVSLYLAGVNINFGQHHQDFMDYVRPLHLPAYAFDNKTYWIQYTGDWNLRKAELAAGDLTLPSPKEHTFSTTSVQKIESEHVDENKALLVAASRVSEPNLAKAINGHLVNQTALCPSSIYADQALTLGEYVQSSIWPGVVPNPVNVGPMEVFKPLILGEIPDPDRTIRLKASIDIKERRGEVIFSSGSGKQQIQHAKCALGFDIKVDDLLSRWQRQMYLIRERISFLEEASASGKAHRMLRGMVYKLFGGFVQYSDTFQGMEEVIMTSELEATAKINFQTTKADGHFRFNPYWIDSVCHLAGFILNANDSIDSSKIVYVSHGWQSMRFAEDLKEDKTYRSYVKMQPLTSDIMAGDVYILEGDRIVGVCEALKFQGISRNLLNTFLPPKGSNAKINTQAPSARPTAPSPRVNKFSKRTASPSRVSVLDKVLDIIALEIGVPRAELSDPVEFGTVGVDSLMSLTISGRIREELGIEFQPSTFADYPTVGAVKALIRNTTGENDLQSVGTNPTISEASSEDLDDLSSVSTELTPPVTPDPAEDRHSLSNALRRTISEAMDVDESELMSIEDLSTSGMDSLMALTILGQLRETTSLNLAADFFTENRSIKMMEDSLNIAPLKKATAKDLTAPSELQMDHARSDRGLEKVSAKSKTRKPRPDSKASSILLQGDPKTATKQFWLVPDGGGSPTSYSFPLISPDLVTWGLISPFVKTPERFIVGVPGIASMYIEQMKRRQPNGPYNIGGWSAGGVISYEVTRQLIEARERVETLILIDSPPPSIIEPLPGSLHRFFASIGLLGDGDGVLEKLPEWLLPHFAASVQALSTYDAEPLPKNLDTNVWILWCEDGVLKDPDTPRPDPYPYGHAQWLLECRTDFGPTEWAEFLREDKIQIERVKGNHFTMMREPLAANVAAFLRRALAS